MKAWILAVACLAMLGAARKPATRPAASRPVLIDMKPMDAKVDAARTALEKAKVDQQEKWEASAERKADLRTVAQRRMAARSGEGRGRRQGEARRQCRLQHRPTGGRKGEHPSADAVGGNQPIAGRAERR